MTPSSSGDALFPEIRAAMDGSSGSKEHIDSNKKNIALPWLAGLAGLSATAAALVVAKFGFSVKGAYITCHLVSQVASNTLAAGTLTASGGAMLATAVVVGIAVADAVYFVLGGNCTNGQQSIGPVLFN